MFQTLGVALAVDIGVRSLTPSYVTLALSLLFSLQSGFPQTQGQA
jgi:hypothetical protein